jgi:PAS domain S-box-containing protein
MDRAERVGSMAQIEGTILVLEDDPGVARLERLRLERAGFAVAAAETDDDARRLIERGGIDLMLLDYRLAGNASGLDFYRELKDAGLAVPSILVTGFGDELMLTEAIRTGIRDFLPKTLDYLDFLVPTVHRVLAQVRTERQLEDQRETLIREQAALAEAQAGEEKLRLILENVRGHAIFTLDLQGNVASWNAGAKEVFGYDAAEILGRHCDLIFTPEDRIEKRAEREMELCRLEGRAADDRWHIRKDGSRFFAGGSMEALRDEADGLRGFVKVVRDQTERKRLEDERRQYTEQLKQDDRRKNEFLAMLAHELRNPLAAIANAAQLAQRSEAKDHRDWANAIVDKQVRHLARLIEDLLDVSRITRGKIELRKQRLDLIPIIDHAVNTTTPLIEERAHELTVRTPPEPLYVDADPTRMEQILVNLLSNAAKYTNSGGRVQLSALRAGNEIALVVQDSGVGMTPELLARAFDLFAQGDRSVARSEGGLGIGLTLAKRLVEMHCGTITAESEGPGAGTRITIRLPAADAPENQAPQRSGQTQTARQGGMRVLVVDDNADLAAGMARLLKLLGHTVEIALDGRSGLAIARANPPDVIFLDIGLPEMDGYEVARILRAEGFTDVVIVAVSGYGEDLSASPTGNSGFDQHLTKPVDFESLEALLGRLNKST